MNGTNGKQSDFPDVALVPYPVIVAATKGDPDAMKIVLQHFSGYIASLSMRKLCDERGNVYFGVDEDIRQRLQARLMRATATSKQKSEQALSTSLTTFNGIHLDNIEIRMMLHEELKVLVCTLVAVYLFYVFYSWFRALLSLFIANSSGQINVPCLEDALVEVVVKSASAYRYLIGMHSKYMT